MADNDQNNPDTDQYDDQYNEEYQFSDLDALNPEFNQPEGKGSQFDTTPTEGRSTTNVRRNALIAVGIIVLAMIIYKFLGYWFTGRTQPEKSSVPAVDTTAIKQPTKVTRPEAAPPSPAPTPAITTETEREFRQKLNAMEVSQQSLRSEVNSISNQIGSLSSNLSGLSDQVSKLNQTLSQLSSQLEAQSQELAHLKVRLKPKVVKHRVVRRVKPSVVYYIQAVIPGRAWLIASNGSTITVSEGSNISGYGVVKLIDPIQGKIITSSGKIIRFSQQDN
ncbi:type IV secretion protein IcmG [Legionella israelensis]|uniref:Protein IcmG (DotF) n=1 Tax=Legionella israelensis TaxID=454 RepID=A0A0W0W8R0_9GAMM|nr:type IVB secretion system protein IcmG/DotF [Legionella israelensis]KTD28714.1 protein IcmG (DotF) [Legionella israelensis]QBR83245.1 type IV secretion protein IcmG [Legionella israelensis]QBS09378.1 type IV secretion protein IcmG [Legionella israelensis]SCX88852.1 intracellular multiplication protein IcmG [Legionella israelensis DSM 19235]STX60278.1 protein IcmG (DotF) [Legionella israelensis]